MRLLLQWPREIAEYRLGTLGTLLKIERGNIKSTQCFCETALHYSQTLISKLQTKYQKHESFVAEVQVKSRVLPELEETREARFAEDHFAHEATKVKELSSF